MDWKLLWRAYRWPAAWVVVLCTVGGMLGVGPGCLGPVLAGLVLAAELRAR